MQCKIITKITKLVDNNIMPDDIDNRKPEKKKRQMQNSIDMTK